MFGLPNVQKLALTVAMPSLAAMERLKDHGRDMDADQIFDAVLEATGNEKLAEEFSLKRASQQVKDEDSAGQSYSE